MWAGAARWAGAAAFRAAESPNAFVRHGRRWTEAGGPGRPTGAARGHVADGNYTAHRTATLRPPTGACPDLTTTAAAAEAEAVVAVVVVVTEEDAVGPSPVGSAGPREGVVGTVVSSAVWELTLTVTGQRNRRTDGLIIKQTDRRSVGPQQWTPAVRRQAGRKWTNPSGSRSFHCQPGTYPGRRTERLHTYTLGLDRADPYTLGLDRAAPYTPGLD